LVVNMHDHKPTTMELHDATDKVAGNSAGGATPEENRDVIRRQACRIGGMLVLNDGDPPAEGSYVLRVLKPNAPDEVGAPDGMCKRSPIVLTGMDPDPRQLRVLALEVYES